MQVVLVMFRSDGERRSFSVVRNMTIIGRREDCDLRIPVGEVSRKHCRLVMTDDGVRIEDLGSSNGTWVNGQRVQESDLSPGDAVTVGPVQFIVQINGVPDDNDLVPPAPPAPSIDDDDSLMGYTAAPVPSVADSGEFTIDEAPAAPQPTDGDEFPLEEEAAENPLVSPLPTSAVDEGEFDFADEPAAPTPAGLDEFALADELVSEAKPAAEASALDIEEDLGLPEFPASIEASGEDEFEIPDLEATPEKPVAEAPKEGDASDSEWDFVVEETDTEPTSTDFNIDLDSSHPHK